jgi:uncharacterized protein involved in response to NO
LVLALGFLLFVFTVYGNAPVSLALHAFSVGGIGIMTLGMMSRVALGHTGRDVQPPRMVAIALITLVIATLVRVMLPIADLTQYSQWIGLSQILWLLAFTLFMLACIPILTAPRVAGQPG